MCNKNLDELQKEIGYKFKNKKLLQTALTHKTYAYEAKKPLEYNERLEFLGDSILGFIAAEQLHETNRYFSEGELTRRRSMIVNNTYLSEIAEKLNLGEYLKLGVGETKQNGDKNPSTLANTMEAIIGAIYLDSNIETTKEFILKHIFPETI